MHRRCTGDAQIVLIEYGVGAAQTLTKGICHKMWKAGVPMKWALIPYPAYAGLKTNQIRMKTNHDLNKSYYY